MRGRHSRNLYPEGFSEGLLRETVSELRARLELDRPAPAPSSADRASYAFWCGAAVVDAVVTLGVLFAPLALLVRALVR